MTTQAEAAQTMPLNPLLYNDDTTPVRTQDIFGTLYVIAKLYTMGYDMARPSPGDWGGALGSLVAKMDTIQSAISTLSADILKIQEAIQNLPAVMNGVVEAALIRQTLRTAAARASLLRTYMQSRASMRSNFASIQRINEDLIVDLNVFAGWYSENSNGALSFLTTIAPMASTCALCFDFVQVQLWADANPGHTGPYPLDNGDIPNHSALNFFKTAQQAYGEVITATDAALRKYGPESASVFPWAKPTLNSVLDGEMFVYSFDGQSFKEATRSTTLQFAPRRRFDQLFYGLWTAPKAGQSDPDIGLLWTGYYLGGNEPASCRGFPYGAVDKVRYEQAKQRALQIAKAKFEIERFDIVGKDLSKHMEVFNTMRAGVVWGRP